MNVALVGDDPALAAWASRVVAAGGRISSLQVSTAIVAELERLRLIGQQAGGAEQPDVVIAAGQPSKVLSAGRLFGVEVPRLVLPGATDAAALAYGWLPLAEDGAQLRPAFCRRYEPAVRECARRNAAGDLGALTLLRFERIVPVSPAAAASGAAASDASRIPHVMAEADWLTDFDLLRLLGGNYTRITAQRLGDSGAAALETSITLGGDGLPEAVWSVKAGAAPGWRLTLSGSQGTVTLLQSSGQPMAMQWNGQAVATPGPAAEAECLRCFLDEQVQPVAELDLLAPTWDDFVRVCDLMEGARRSLRRRRTIDLHFESTSERSQFKTQMTAIGCGVLTWALLATCGGLILGKVLDPRHGAERRAAAAGTILWVEDFAPVPPLVTPELERRLRESLASDASGAIVLIEADDENPPRNTERLEAVQKVIYSQPLNGTAPQVEVRTLEGRWFHRAMLAVWVVAFGPLAVFLAAQLLIVLTRSRP